MVADRWCLDGTRRGSQGKPGSPRGFLPEETGLVQLVTYHEHPKLVGKNQWNQGPWPFLLSMLLWYGHLTKVCYLIIMSKLNK